MASSLIINCDPLINDAVRRWVAENIGGDPAYLQGGEALDAHAILKEVVKSYLNGATRVILMTTRHEQLDELLWFVDSIECGYRMTAEVFYADEGENGWTMRPVSEAA